MIPYLLNLLDLACTLLAMQLGVMECNPLMRDVAVMIVYKVFIVGLLYLWLSHRPERLAKIGLMISTAIYGALALWHFVGLYTIFF